MECNPLLPLGIKWISSIEWEVLCWLWENNIQHIFTEVKFSEEDETQIAEEPHYLEYDIEWSFILMLCFNFL